MIENLKIIIKKGSLLKSLYYNFRYLEFRKAINLPMIIAKRTIIKGVGKIILKENVSRIYIGYKSLDWCNEKFEYTNIFLGRSSTLFFGEKVFLGCGTKIEVASGGNLFIEEETTFTGKSTIVCKNSIHIGKHCLISWDVILMDSDGHKLTYNEKSNRLGNILIGDDVWIGCKSSVIKNTNIANGCVIASNSLLNKNYSECNCLLAGMPAKKYKSNVKWSFDILERGEQHENQ